MCSCVWDNLVLWDFLWILGILFELKNCVEGLVFGGDLEGGGAVVVEVGGGGGGLWWICRFGRWRWWVSRPVMGSVWEDWVFWLILIGLGGLGILTYISCEGWNRVPGVQVKTYPVREKIISFFTSLLNFLVNYPIEKIVASMLLFYIICPTYFVFPG